ncbi:hypothetical protein PR202_gb25387 [Eleusine coracana subsp. coracana]|uniref:Retrotransposon gag domain-containing protein n=1 Tax=Eleusine coracana subsp. coracana TaxID=191504 RepID=A0AAV5FPF3_ELECO|nr:hypothetical protein PR202_gb25387 [Eleusine coracana subsp. coracana]
MADATYQTPAIQKAVAMLKAVVVQDATKDRSQSRDDNNDDNRQCLHYDDVNLQHRHCPTPSPDRRRWSPTPTDEEMNGIKAYVPRLRIALWPNGFKLVLIEKYDGQTNLWEWLQLHSMVIRSAGGDSYIMANYLPVYLDLSVRIWLTSLPEESITSWGDLNKNLIESFHATYNRLGNHFDLTQIKQKTDEALRDYIKRFCAKKTEIPNVLDQQIIAAFQGGDTQ